MAHIVTPISNRLGFNYSWKSSWSFFKNKNYSYLLLLDILLIKFYYRILTSVLFYKSGYFIDSFKIYRYNNKLFVYFFLPNFIFKYKNFYISNKFSSNYKISKRLNFFKNLTFVKKSLKEKFKTSSSLNFSIKNFGLSVVKNKKKQIIYYYKLYLIFLINLNVFRKKKNLYNLKLLAFYQKMNVNLFVNKNLLEIIYFLEFNVLTKELGLKNINLINVSLSLDKNIRSFKKVKFVNFFRYYFLNQEFLNLFKFSIYARFNEFFKQIGLSNNFLLRFKILPIYSVSSNTIAHFFISKYEQDPQMFNFIMKIIIKELNNLPIPILGFKIAVSGRFNRKTRGSYLVYKNGFLPLNSFSLPIDYCERPFITKYGLGSIKVWLYHKPKLMFKNNNIQITNKNKMQNLKLKSKRKYALYT